MSEGIPAGAARTVANMQLVGGRWVVDFVNTVSDRTTGTPYDRLRTYGDLLEWCVRVELLDRPAADALGAAASARPADARAALERARALREALFEVFTSVTEGREPAGPALDEVNAVLAEGMASRRLQPGRNGIFWNWADRATRLDWVLWPLALSAGELLTSSDVGRLKTCGQDDCRWMFVDLSKNRSRRWCTMEDCGNRAKARRHYHRHRTET